MVPLLRIPTELFLHIAEYLQITDILHLRRTCTRLADYTRNKTLWISILRLQGSSLPIDIEQQSLSSNELEQAILSAYRSQITWPKPRRPTLRLHPKSCDSILALEIVCEKWLLAVYCEGIAYLWHIHGGRVLHTCVVKSRGGWSSCAVAVEEENKTIILATTHAGGPSTTRIYRVFLTEPSLEVNKASLLNTLHSPTACIIRAIDPVSHLVLFSRSHYIDVMHWDTKESVTISTQTEELDELWNGIISLRLCAPYILCVKTRSVELYPIPIPGVLTSDCTSHPLKHVFPRVTLRDVSVSSPSYTPSPEDPSVTFLTVSFLAYDVLQGLFHYRLTVNYPSTPTLTSQSGSTLLSHLGLTLLGTHCLIHAVPPGQGTSRGFVSTCRLGPRGLRGLWVERTRGSTRRCVAVFSHPFSNGVGAALDGNGEDLANVMSAPTPVISGQMVYEVGSYDLREDLILCAFSEVTGQIALGLRSGDIQIL